MEWISVKDRLPDGAQLVLCIGDGHTPSMAKFNKAFKSFERYTDYVDGDRIMAIEYTKITHWMPLPEVPNTTLTKEQMRQQDDLSEQREEYD